MTTQNSNDAEKTLQQNSIHDEWVDNYRTPDNELFYNMAFDFIRDSFEQIDGDQVLDAGCGSCAKSKNLVDRGYQVVGTDLSESALDLARKGLAGSDYDDKIELRCENLTKLTIEDESFSKVLCWGVLMHIPDVDKAISELSRIVKRGGILAISEGNMHSLQTIAIRLLKKILGREKAVVNIVDAGIENWEETGDGRLMTRQANIDWYVKEFEKHGLELVSRRAGQFTELYWVVSSSVLKKVIHYFNKIWFKYIKIPGPAFGNILILRKK
ncbi:class I SAM-dependent methyltransferase [Candidatus Thiodiazotropha sp. CDECU1]|uniref:class I SAM-dependent methyltransferase n=1 Tax=Candidatus Thiodiazotropha sp. CDECU1 TaxID=3065865 RepID=UPI00292D54AB|nr:class I SAM-dependent methyltransferase [Candidatus Thiodiazotropha sp. CDECU1]